MTLLGVGLLPLAGRGSRAALTSLLSLPLKTSSSHGAQPRSRLKRLRWAAFTACSSIRAQRRVAPVRDRSQRVAARADPDQPEIAHQLVQRRQPVAVQIGEAEQVVPGQRPDRQGPRPRRASRSRDRAARAGRPALGAAGSGARRRADRAGAGSGRRCSRSPPRRSARRRNVRRTRRGWRARPVDPRGGRPRSGTRSDPDRARRARPRAPRAGIRRRTSRPRARAPRAPARVRACAPCDRNSARCDAIICGRRCAE